MNQFSTMFPYRKELLIFRKRPMCWMAIGFLLIISVFLLGRSYKEALYSEDLGEVFLEGTITNKQYKESVYGGCWQVTLKNVKVLRKGEEEGSPLVLQRENSNRRNIESLEGKYICQITAVEKAEPGQSSGNKEYDLKIGQQILLSGKYTPWEQPTNPGQFDAGKYYCSQGILGQFKKCKVLRQGTKYSQFQEGMWNFRQEANQFLMSELGDDDGGLISAMLLGEKSGLDEEDKNLYQRNGISHILAISGLHLMLLGMGVFRVLKVMFRGSKQAAVFGIFIMSIYCVFTGNSISTIRATIMFSLSLIAGILGRSYDSLSALGLAAILQLFMNPYVLNNSGFLMSFLAVIGVTFITPKLQELLGAKRKLVKSLCVSISSSITTLPVLLCNYGTYSWYSVFLNLFILPAMSTLLFLAVVLVMLCGIIGNGTVVEIGTIGNGTVAEIGTIEGFGSTMETILFVLMKLKEFIVIGIKLILKYFEICCKLFEYSPFQDGYIGAPAKLQIVFYACLVVVAISGIIKHSFFARKMILLSAITILTMRFDFGTELTMLDVGQGDGIVIRNSNGHVYISDCGSSSVSKVGKYRLIPFLKYKGYGKIKGIFVSHLDEDHMNGLVELLEMAPEEKIEIEYLFLPESVLGIEEDREILGKLESLAGQNETEVVYLKQGDKIKDGKMEFLCLHPENSEQWGNLDDDRNNQSLVLFMKYENFEMLLTGDVEKQGELEIEEYIDRMSLLKRDNGDKEDRERDGLDYYERLRQCDVLKVAHHGSSGSSSEEFLKIVNPKLSLISCGKNNSYGHPHRETLERLKKVESEVMTTTESGAISVRINKKYFTIEEYVKEKNK